MLKAAGVSGGLIVHLGCGDGKLTAALADRNGCLVHGLDADPQNVDAARAFIRSRNLCGRASIDRLDGDWLPYVDNLVSLLVASGPCRIPGGEVLRVLAPGGVALAPEGSDWTSAVRPEEATAARVTIGGQTWIRIVKVRPPDIDEWTHYLHGPDNNAVSHDRGVSSPFHVQWVCGPKWARHHNHLSSTSAMVSAGGRLFAIVDEGPIASLVQPPQYRLVARDAFNGVVLWKREVGPWESHLRPFRSGPPELVRRLVAAGDRVYVTLGYGQKVSILDAATGSLIRKCEGTDGALEMVLDQGVLYVVAGSIEAAADDAARRRGRPSVPPKDKRIVAVDAQSGAMLWRKFDADTYELLPTTLCVADDGVFFQNTTHVICLDRRSGQVRWRAARPVRTNRPSWSAPTLVVHGGVVLSADCAAPPSVNRPSDQPPRMKWTITSRPETRPQWVGELIAFSAADGHGLWRAPAGHGYNAPPDVFVVGGLVWASAVPGRNTTDFTEGRDLSTGEVKRRLHTEPAFTQTHHHRCYRDKATERFILLGRTGVELIDLQGGKSLRHCWIRGACQYGVMPANGLLYLPPHACACYIQSKLSGFWALAPKRRAEDQDATVEPTNRLDPGRTGRTDMRPPAELAPVWETSVSGRLSSPVIAEGVLLVAAVDDRQIHALDAHTGRTRWRHAVGGRVDSPPTIDSGLAVFGCADGYVYCLRLADGALVWRFRAAPVDRRTVAFGQLESVWPVTGSVLIRNGVVYCTAGRSSYLDGGMYLYRLDLRSGRLLGQTRFYDRDPETGEQPEDIIEDVELPGALPDVLVDDGQHLFLRDKVLDAQGVPQPGYVPHLYCSAGLLDDTWWHQTYWLWGERTWGRASGWHVMARIRPSGRILVTDATTVFGYGRKSVRGISLEGCHLFRADKQVQTINKTIKNNNVALTKYQRPAKVRYHWSREVPIVVRAMVLADDMLFAAGPLMPGRGQSVKEPTFEAANPAAIMAFGAEDGRELMRRKLSAQPVFDGMAAAYGRLYLCTVDGKVVCLGGS